MPNIPCKIKALCTDPSAPITNFTSEGPDADDFYSYASRNQADPPMPGQNWNPDAIFGTGNCISPVSQQEADLCAGRIAPTDPGNPEQSPFSDPPNDNLPHHSPGPVPVFYSHQASCTVTCPDGSPFNFTVAAGAFVNRSQILADRAANSLACTQARRLRICLGSIPANCCFGQPFTATIPISTTDNILSVSLNSGALPDGLGLSFTPGTKSIFISGTPTVGGNFSFTLRALDGFGNQMIKSYSICVVQIMPANLPPAMQGTAYSEQLSLSCGVADSWDVFGGEFPAGLSLDLETGTIEGTPTEGGTFNFTVEATLGTTKCTQDCSLAVTALPTGWKICDWPFVLSQLVGFGACAGSGQPAWNGAFNLLTTAVLPAGSQLWYFINQSISGSRTAASDAPDYPAGNWPNLDCFTQLYYNAGTGTWDLFIACADACIAQEIWNGTMTNNNPNDPSGIYVNDGFGASADPETIQISAVTSKCCPQWDQVAWGVPTPTNVGAGTSSFTPNNADGAIFHAVADAPDGSVDSALITNTGTVHYNGDPCNFNLHVVMTKIANPAVNTGNTTGSVQVSFIADGGPTFVLLTATFNTTPSLTGTFDFPFNLPFPLGPGVMSVVCNVRAPRQFTLAAGHQAIDLVCTLSNLP